MESLRGRGVYDRPLVFIYPFLIGHSSRPTLYGFSKLPGVARTLLSKMTCHGSIAAAPQRSSNC